MVAPLTAPSRTQVKNSPRKSDCQAAPPLTFIEEDKLRISFVCVYAKSGRDWLPDFAFLLCLPTDSMRIPITRSGSVSEPRTISTSLTRSRWSIGLKPARAGSGDVITLLEVQRRMANAIFQPMTRSDRMPGGADAEFIKPNNRLTSLERLEIYSWSYWFRILDSLYDDFPGLRAVLGERDFRRLSRAYLAECPSRSFTLRDLGSRLVEWLERNPRYGGSCQALAINMARLEWAHIEAFDNAAEKALAPGDLLELGPDFRARLQPYIRLLGLEYP